MSKLPIAPGFGFGHKWRNEFRHCFGYGRNCLLTYGATLGYSRNRKNHFRSVSNVRILRLLMLNDFWKKGPFLHVEYTHWSAMASVVGVNVIQHAGWHQLMSNNLEMRKQAWWVPISKWAWFLVADDDLHFPIFVKAMHSSRCAQLWLLCTLQGL